MEHSRKKQKAKSKKQKAKSKKQKAKSKKQKAKTAYTAIKDMKIKVAKQTIEHDIEIIADCLCVTKQTAINYINKK